MLFEDGKMYKIKCQWYVDKSKLASKELSTFEKDLWALVLDNRLDDVADALGDRKRKQIEDFGVELFQKIKEASEKINKLVVDAKMRNIKKKDFVAEINQLAKIDNDPLLKHKCLHFKTFDGGDSFECVKQYLRQHCSNRNKLEEVRYDICGDVKISI